jgi:hypothetical protein
LLIDGAGYLKLFLRNPNFLQRLRENEALKAAESLTKKNKRAKSSEINGIKINSMLKPKLIKELKKLNLSSEGNVAELKLRLTNYIDSEKNDKSDDKKGITTLFNVKSKDKEVKGDEKKDKKVEKESPVKTGNEYSKILVKGYNDMKKSFYPSQKKVDENIERIKGLLK